MSIRLPQTNSRTIFLLLGAGLVLLLWLSLEDNGTVSVALLGTGAVILFTIIAILNRIGGYVLPIRLWFTGLIGLGAAIGALSTLATTFLMFFKTSWHGHVFPDYPPAMMLAMLERLPVWMLAGALIGLAIALIKLATSPSENTLES